jgi:RNA polymerase sigma-70 factor (ECF subfamily)
MDEQNRVTDLEELLQNASWVKNLAYASLRDYALAEDVSQEVLLKAIAEPKRSGRVLRAWLATVTRNMARNEIRGLMRRRARERKVFERSTGADNDLNQTDLMHAHRDLTYVVESLAPKHREVIVQRFFEGLSFREVALNLGISQGNVRIRLHRALQELRTILEDRSGDWYASCLLLAPMGSAPVPVSALPKAAQFMAAVVAASVIGSVWLWQGAEHANSEPIEQALIAQTGGSEESVALSNAAISDLANANQQQIERETLAPATALPLVPKPREGLVLYDGFPVPGAQIVVGQETGISIPTTDAEG